MAEGLRLYHSHEVVGLENVPRTGAGLIIVNHSLATYDIALLIAVIRRQLGRTVRPLVDRLFFKIPGLGPLVESVGCVEGSQETASRLLEEGELVCVAPGGMKEALRPSTEKYKICWETRRGFVRLALNAHCPIVPAACPNADDLYHIYDNPVTKLGYELLRIPLPIAKGLSWTGLPRPIKLSHHIGVPIMPPKLARSKKGIEKQVQDLHRDVVRAMEALMQTKPASTV